MVANNKKNQYTKKGVHGFLKGNPGKPKGRVSESVLLSRKLLGNHTEALMQQCIDLALNGDKQMLRFLVGRFAGRIDSVISPSGKTPAELLRSIIEQLKVDGVTAGDASGHVEIIKALTTAIELEDYGKKLKKLEKKASKKAKKWKKKG